LGAEASENICEEEIVVEACLVRSVIPAENEAVIWVLGASACDMV
jgi:hypothetical protein